MPIACKACKKFHPAMMPCSTAANLIKSDYLEEPWRSLNRGEHQDAVVATTFAALITPVAAPAKPPKTKPKKQAKVDTEKTKFRTSDGKFDRTAYMKDYMARLRKRQREANGKKPTRSGAARGRQPRSAPVLTSGVGVIAHKV